MGSISLSSWLKAAENEFRSIPLVAENEENISLTMAEGCGERICLASVPGENFTCERWSPISTFISSIDFARAMI